MALIIIGMVIAYTYSETNPVKRANNPKISPANLPGSLSLTQAKYKCLTPNACRSALFSL